MTKPTERALDEKSRRVERQVTTVGGDGGPRSPMPILEGRSHCVAPCPLRRSGSCSHCRSRRRLGYHHRDECRRRADRHPAPGAPVSTVEVSPSASAPGGRPASWVATSVLEVSLVSASFGGSCPASGQTGAQVWVTPPTHAATTVRHGPSPQEIVPRPSSAPPTQ